MRKYLGIIMVLAMVSTGAMAGEVIYTGSNDLVQLGIPTGDAAEGDWNDAALTSVGATPTGYLISTSGAQADFYFPVDPLSPVATPLAFDIASQDWSITMTVDASTDGVSAGIMLRDYDAASGAGNFDGFEVQYDWGSQEIVIWINDGTGWVGTTEAFTHTGPITLRMMANGTNIDMQYDIGGGFQTVLSEPAPGAGDLQDGNMYPSFRPSQDGSVDAVALTNIIAFGTGVPDVVQQPPVIPAIPTITPSSPYAVAGQAFSLSAPAGGTGYQWSNGIGEISGANSEVLAFDPVEESDFGTYSVMYTDGETEELVNISYILFVYPAETTVPLTGLLGLGLLAGACALGGASVLRRKQ